MRGDGPVPKLPEVHAPVRCFNWNKCYLPSEVGSRRPLYFSYSLLPFTMSSMLLIRFFQRLSDRRWPFLDGWSSFSTIRRSIKYSASSFIMLKTLPSPNSQLNRVTAMAVLNLIQNVSIFDEIVDFIYTYMLPHYLHKNFATFYFIKR